jgi:hypothetical protein
MIAVTVSLREALVLRSLLTAPQISLDATTGSFLIYLEAFMADSSLPHSNCERQFTLSFQLRS